MKRQFLLVCIFILAACKPLITASPVPTRTILRLGYQPALRPWADRVSRCANQIPGISIAYYETTGLNQQDHDPDFDLVLRFSVGFSFAAYTTRIGSEELLWIVNAANPTKKLTPEQFAGLYSGELTNWSQIAGEAFDDPVELWIYPPGDPLYQVMQTTFQRSRANLTGAFLAPDTAAMLEAVSAQPGALGYIPSSWLEEGAVVPGVKQLPALEAEEEAEGHILDILAITTVEPEAEIRSLLLCTQEQGG